MLVSCAPWRVLVAVWSRGASTGCGPDGRRRRKRRMKDDAHRAGGRRYAPSVISLHVQLTGVNALNGGLPDNDRGGLALVAPGLVRGVRGRRFGPVAGVVVRAFFTRSGRGYQFWRALQTCRFTYRLAMMRPSRRVTGHDVGGDPRGQVGSSRLIAPARVPRGSP